MSGGFRGPSHSRHISVDRGSPPHRRGWEEDEGLDCGAHGPVLVHLSAAPCNQTEGRGDESKWEGGEGLTAGTKHPL